MPHPPWQPLQFRDIRRCDLAALGHHFDRNGETQPKHPTQLYEALSYLILGLTLLWFYWKKADRTWRGFHFGWFMVGCFGMRFIIEFIKEPQVEFENGMLLDMGQILSIPFIIAGICMVIWSYKARRPMLAEPPLAKKPEKKASTHYAKPLN